MEQLFNKYENIQLFATKYRGYTLIDNFHDYETFKNKMQIFEYVLHKFKNPKMPGNDIDLYLFSNDSKYISSTNFFKKILDNYIKGEHNIIMITKEELNVYRRKSIKSYPNINLKNYLHKHFIMEINKGPLCSKHTILSPEEVRAVCYTLMTHGHKLAAIFESDPQNIWIGGEINDIIRIESYSEITGKSIRYRIVTPASGKVLQSPSPAVVVKKEANNTIVEEDIGAEDDANDANNEDYIDDYVDEIDEDD